MSHFFTEVDKMGSCCARLVRVGENTVDIDPRRPLYLCFLGLPLWICRPLREAHLQKDKKHVPSISGLNNP